MLTARLVRRDDNDCAGGDCDSAILDSGLRIHFYHNVFAGQLLQVAMGCQTCEENVRRRVDDL